MSTTTPESNSLLEKEQAGAHDLTRRVIDQVITQGKKEPNSSIYRYHRDLPDGRRVILSATNIHAPEPATTDMSTAYPQAGLSIAYSNLRPDQAGYNIWYDVESGGFDFFELYSGPVNKLSLNKRDLKNQPNLAHNLLELYTDELKFLDTLLSIPPQE